MRFVLAVGLVASSAGSDPAWPDRFLGRAAALLFPPSGAVACAPSH